MQQFLNIRYYGENVKKITFNNNFILKMNLFFSGILRKTFNIFFSGKKCKEGNMNVGDDLCLENVNSTNDFLDFCGQDRENGLYARAASVDKWCT